MSGRGPCSHCPPGCGSCWPPDCECYDHQDWPDTRPDPALAARLARCLDAAGCDGHSHDIACNNALTEETPVTHQWRAVEVTQMQRALDAARRAGAAEAEAQIRDLLEEREELLTEIRRLRMGNHPAGRALMVPKKHGSPFGLALAEALTERDAEHEGDGGA